jgi:uncharacterized protein
VSRLIRLVHAFDLESLPLQVDGPRVGATAGRPEESSAELYDDGRVQIGVWECTPGEFPAAKDGITEHMYVLAGNATLHGADGTTVELRAGVSVVTPDGWSGRWEIRETVRKLYSIWHTA